MAEHNSYYLYGDVSIYPYPKFTTGLAYLY